MWHTVFGTASWWRVQSRNWGAIICAFCNNRISFGVQERSSGGWEFDKSEH